ncbi:histidinol-phosphatase (PHP family) [Halobacillus dabanensis]|uniref:Histidinol-phosphatase n=1 Tax=Halobacillus dabanensis TaxID=240302 RepID=A0A1I3NQU9_HALDA|nr:histidinol-phosphatase HisJ [Halobacillus dabanensis]SFJ11579.1 histidinol-phosphatase (PHP family) [Halobacillus dabanensis]
MRDGHIHSPYCPHGTTDSLKEYIEQGIQLGYQSMTFTEHAPLPPSFSDPVPQKDSGMALSEVETYLKEIEKLKEIYKHDIEILKGFEIDFIEGYEKETKSFLDTYGPSLDDSILSVHFQKGDNGWYCIDYSPDMYEAALRDLGGTQKLYEAYYKTLIKSIHSDLGKYKPIRIGHMTLVKKFQNLFPYPDHWTAYAIEFLEVVKENDYTLDYNGAGIKKSHCKEAYPPLGLARQAYEMGIPLIYGSDAHAASALGQGLEEIEKTLLKP